MRPWGKSPTVDLPAPCGGSRTAYACSTEMLPEPTSSCRTTQVSRPSRPSRTGFSSSGEWRLLQLLQSWIVVPEEVQWLTAWDLWIVTMLFITTYYEPYAVAVVDEDPTWALGLNHLLDLTFTVDLLLTFIIAYGEPLEGAAENSLWVKDPVRIAARYMRWPLSEGCRAGWFWIDLATVLPGWLEVILPRGSTPKYNQGLVLLRLLRLARITKLVRLQHLLRKWHQEYGLPFYVVELGKFFFVTTLTVHWMACGWIIIEGQITSGKFSYKTEKESWLSALVKAKGDSCTPNAKDDPNCVYLISLYWATMTLTTVGYGDITAQNPMEYVVCNLSMLVVAYVWAYVVGKMVTLLGSFDPAWHQFTETMDTLQSLMQSRGLPGDLQVRLRKYMHESRGTSEQMVQRHHLQEQVSQNLQREVAHFSGNIAATFVRNVFWAQGLQEHVLLDVVRALEPCSFGPGEIMMLPQTLILMRRGLSAVKGRILKRGDVWGQSDILLLTEALIERASPRALTYAEVLLLRRPALLEICSNSAHADKRLRRAQIRTATFRAFIKTARERAGSGGAVPRPSLPLLQPSAATSFVDPGQRKLHSLTLTGARHREETEAEQLSDLRLLLQTLAERHDSLEASLGCILTNELHWAGT